MNTSTIQSPGVYINELNAFPNSTTAVQTAVPAFIGYTPQALYDGKSCTNVPVRITSFADFKDFFCLPDPPPPANAAVQYSPQYYFLQQKAEPQKGDYMIINNSHYSIVPDPNTIYYMYNAIKLFYQNGGGTAYIVSVGGYGAASGNAMTPGAQIVNANVSLTDLQLGLKTLLPQPEPTIYICPDATLLSVENNSTLMQSMLAQNVQTGTAISIFDVIGGTNPDPAALTGTITTFRSGTGLQGLDYGVAYFPFIGTTVMQGAALNYTNLFGGDTQKLNALINPNAADSNVNAIITNINNPASGLTVVQNNNALLNASPIYKAMMQQVLSIANLLPPASAMAGVITTIDNSEGVWQSPANVSIVGAVSLPIKLTDAQQAGLNTDAVSGKSINAIRSFNGLGILVWGARTLDGNSLDWKYISVRRTMIYLEQSCKQITQQYALSPNVAMTWSSVTSLISSFLTEVWKAGGLQGASAADAFAVSCGLGSTMTGDDILNGFMNVTVKVAVVRPAEFIVISFQQQMTAQE